MKPYYQDAWVTIYHANAGDFIRNITFDVLLTDPPYGIGENKGGALSNAAAKGEYSGAFSDTQDYLKSVVVPIVSTALATAKRGALTCGRNNQWHFPMPVDVGCFYQPAATGVSFWGRGTWQPILFYGKAPHSGEQLRPLHYVLTEAPEKLGHPCSKPILAWSWLLQKISKEGETVLDPFMGSGTTLRAAKDCGRKAIGIEIEERYAEIAAKRMGQEVFDFSSPL